MFTNILFVSLPYCIAMKLIPICHIGLIEILDVRGGEGEGGGRKGMDESRK